MKSSPKVAKIIIGVLSIQGSAREHLQALGSLGVATKEIKTVEDMQKIDGLIIPGGESTTIGKLLQWFKIDQEIVKMAKKGLPIYGTCAGAILLAKTIDGSEKANNLGLMDIVIERNAYGRQVDSFSTVINIPKIDKKPFQAVFIRAPRLKKVGKNVKILAQYAGEPVMAREGNILVSMFHPEMTEDGRVHEYFVEMVRRSKQR